jgi:putative sterol carrier protein
VATVEECEAAMHKLAERLRSPDGEEARGKMIDRSISCHLRDLDVTFGGQLRGGEIVDIHRTPTPDGQIKLSTTSDDLVALVDGRLNFAKAWAAGRLKVDANMFDLFKLRSLL